MNKPIITHQDAVLYIVSGYCLSLYKFIADVNSSAIPIVKKLQRMMDKNKAESSGFFKRTTESSLRKDLLNKFLKTLASHDTLEDFVNGRSSYIHVVQASVLFFSVAKSLGFDESQVECAISPFNTVSFIEQLTRIISNTQLHVRQYTLHLTQACVEVFKQFSQSVKESHLDASYRGPFRKSLHSALQNIMREMGDAYWRDKFPERGQERSYDLSDKALIYEWSVPETFRDTVMVMKYPNNPLLEAHERANLNVAITAVAALTEQADDLPFEEIILSILVCVPDSVGEKYLGNLDMTGEEKLSWKANAHADKIAICTLACSQLEGLSI